MALKLVELPTEMLEHIFIHVDPQSLLAVSQTSHFLKNLTRGSPLIWRHFCKIHYRTWAAHHDIANKFAGPLSAVDWRSLYIRRVQVEREALHLLDCVLQSPTNRNRHINELADFGFDVKETLLKEIACADDTEDVLARRYYAKAILERIQRDMSIRVWRDLHNGNDVAIEHALGAYDVFTRIGPDVDFDTITSDVNNLALTLLDQNPGFPRWSTRRKASLVVSFLHEQGFRGVSDTSYHALRNNFIGFALHNPAHESLPLISVGIFCALARRLGLDARPCGFVFHVYCIVYAPKNYSLDGDYKPTSSDERQAMYLDPFRSSDEVEMLDLERVLRDMGIPAREYETFLAHTTAREMVLRTARNIMNSVQTIRQSNVGANGINSTWVNAYPDIDVSFYASIWSMIMLGPREEESGGLSNISTRRRQYLPYLLDHLRSHHPWDVSLLRRYVVPFFTNEQERYRLDNFCAAMQRLDARPATPKRRCGNARRVKYKVGQIFKHKRYHYEGIITGWDVECDAGEEWIQNMGVDRLDGGRTQSFYHVLVSDKSLRYVAEENIAMVPEWHEPTDAILTLAGRHFKRWDGELRRFISNIKEEYPDD
ncbi:YccV-like-domain-containing protein [Massarina eburnea CBS 473.64]|uniref:YccV-like-domain-containing protein n=1 Tax=Massarina eburnea CBS 473.64 TaxID=1395130 RepID=A0A6A6S1Q1_9PLEO|nr:YccV-like-domain-containing protein [Massarina eburnea CBS 473.64]